MFHEFMALYSITKTVLDQISGCTCVKILLILLLLSHLSDELLCCEPLNLNRRPVRQCKESMHPSVTSIHKLYVICPHWDPKSMLKLEVRIHSTCRTEQTKAILSPKSAALDYSMTRNQAWHGTSEPKTFANRSVSKIRLTPRIRLGQ